MRPHQRIRDDITIRLIARIVSKNAILYNNRRDRAIREGWWSDQQAQTNLRWFVFDKFHSDLRDVLSARITSRLFKDLCMLLVNRRSDNDWNREVTPTRFITGAVEGIWDMYFDIDFPFQETS